jgi:hypothetical protein
MYAQIDLMSVEYFKSTGIKNKANFYSGTELKIAFKRGEEKKSVESSAHQQVMTVQN